MLRHEYGVLWSCREPVHGNVDGPFPSSRRARAYARNIVEGRVESALPVEYALVRRIGGTSPWVDFQSRPVPEAFSARWNDGQDRT